jgi:hypothetical protein
VLPSLGDGGSFYHVTHAVELMAVNHRDHFDPAIPVGMETSAGTVVS